MGVLGQELKAIPRAMEQKQNVIAEQSIEEESWL